MVFQFSPEGEHCAAKAGLTYEKQNTDVPDPDKYMEFTRGMLMSVDAYLLKAWKMSLKWRIDIFRMVMYCVC